MQDHRRLSCDGDFCAFETATLGHLQSQRFNAEKRVTRDCNTFVAA
jgi:hypothetical protein